MRVLVTGANGFVGQNFCKNVAADFDVVALVRNESGRFNDLCRVFDGSYDSLLSAMNGVDVVLHLATCYVADHCHDIIPNMVQSNIEFGTLLLEAMNQSGVSRIVNVGTVWQKYEAKDYRYGNLYAATKQAFQEIVSWYCDSKGFSAINLHLSDTYGEGDKRKKILQLLLNLAESGEPLDMSGGVQKIELTHIDDVVQALYIACDLVSEQVKHSCTTYSLLTGNEISLKNLAIVVESVIGKPLKINWGVRPYRDREVMSTPHNAYQKLPVWQPQVSLHEGIRRVFQS